MGYSGMSCTAVVEEIADAVEKVFLWRAAAAFSRNGVFGWLVRGKEVGTDQWP